MDGLTEDEALQLAIQMSLQASTEPPAKHTATSAQGTNLECESRSGNVNKRKADSDAQSPSADSQTPPQMSNHGIFGLDRRKMEEERLARLGLRSGLTKSKSPPLTQGDSGNNAKRRKLAQGMRVTASGSSVNETVNSSLDTKQRSRALKQGNLEPSMQFAKPTIKRTWARGRVRGDDITIDEVLQKDRLRKAVLSSFQWDHNWLFQKLDTRKTDLLMIVQAKTIAEQDQIRAEGKQTNPRIKLCFPPMPGQVNCMHSKLMLLFYDDYMRVVVPTANLTLYDWGDDNRMENMVFIVDLPGPLEMAASDLRQLDQMTAFAQSLEYFLERQGVPDSLCMALRRYDFSATRSLAFIHSVGGSHFGDDMFQNGYPGLSRAVRNLGLDTSSDIEIDIASASLGSLTHDFLQLIYSAAQGRRQKDMRELHGGLAASMPPNLQQHFRIYFPLHSTVAGSVGGVNAGGTICLQRKWYSGPKFPRHLMRDYKSLRAGLLSHNKLLIVRGTRESDSSKPEPFAWAFVGSHNLSESAWGKVVQDKGKGRPLKLNCRNWECGVLFPIRPDSELDGVPSMDSLKGSIDIPFEYPGEEYRGRQPWFFMDS